MLVYFSKANFLGSEAMMEVAVKVRVKKDYSFRNEVRNLSAVALIIND